MKLPMSKVLNDLAARSRVIEDIGGSISSVSIAITEDGADIAWNADIPNAKNFSIKNPPPPPFER